MNYFADWDGNLLNRSASLWFSYSGTMQSYLFVRGWRMMEAFNKKEFDQTFFYLEGGLWPASDLIVSVSTLFGDEIDYANTRLGNRIRVTPNSSYNLGKHLRLSLSHTYERMSVQDARLYTANISQLSAVYQFNVRTFFRA
ncbi:MAG: hypothetical protein GTO40_21560, partial [Deltaproteobacteria bacterium]|nr:hypothetical protein [Deltaproteobacteria bacterium]